jgi:hypothetical protein
MLKKLLTLLLIVSPCLAQNARKDDVAMVVVTQATSLGNVTMLQPVPGATVTIGQGDNSCTITSGVASCSPLALICSSSSDVVCSQPNPTNADANGNYGFWLQPGRYTVALTSLTTSGRVIVYDMGVGLTDPSGAQDLPAFLYLASATANSAHTGAIRLANTDAFNWRNSTNSGDVGLVVSGPASGSRPADAIIPNGGAGGFWSIFYSDASTNSANSGTFRLSSTSTIDWRNNANTADLALSKDSSDNFHLPNSLFLGATIVLPALTAGNCVQAGIGGALTTTGGPCGAASGFVTTTGTPAAANVAIFSGAASVTGTNNLNADTSGNLSALSYIFTGNASVPSGTGAEFFNQSGVGPTLSGLNISFRAGPSTPTEIARVTSGGINLVSGGLTGTGNFLPTSLFNSGSGASSTTFWRGDGTWASVSGVSVAAAVNLTGQSANIGATTLVTIGANGFYRISCYTVLTQVATTSATMPACLLLYTDADSGVAETQTVTIATSGNTLGLLSQQAASVGGDAYSGYGFYAKSGSNIQYQIINYASNGATSMQYALHIRLEGPF